MRSYDRNIAVNVWWTPLLEFDTSDCKHTKFEGLPTFDKYRFQVLDNSNMEEDNVDDDDDDDLTAAADIK